MKAAAIVCIVIGALLILYFIACAIITKKMFCPKKRTNEMLIEYEAREKNLNKAWLDIPYVDLKLKSQYGENLHGRLYMNKNETNKIILSLHGHNNSSIGQLKYLNIFLDMGYNVFIPDHRRSGTSEGKFITFGAYEKNDVLAWIRLLSKSFPNATFAIFGESMGAATAIMVTAAEPKIRYLIEYCGYASIPDLLSGITHSKPVSKVLYPGMSLLTGAFFGFDLRECNAKKAMAEIKVPTLMMHSRADKVVAFSNAQILHDANPNAELVEFEDSIHARSWVKYPDKFTETVKTFIAKQDKS